MIAATKVQQGRPGEKERNNVGNSNLDGWFKISRPLARARELHKVTPARGSQAAARAGYNLLVGSGHFKSAVTDEKARV